MANEMYLELVAKIDKDVKKLQNQIDSSFSGKLSFKIDPKIDTPALNKVMDEIQSKAGQVQSVKIGSGFDKEGVQQIANATVTWSDKLGNVYKQFVMIDSEIQASVYSTKNLAKEENEVLKLEKQKTAVLEKNAKILDAGSKKAETFLAKYEFMSKSTQGDKLKSLAESIQEAASSGNVAKVKSLSREFDILKGTLSAATGESYNLGKEMGAVIRRTLESATTLGLMYGALNQLRQGIQYVKDLDKELTNVQVVTGMSEKSVQALALQYNSLAKEMGVTTLEIAKGNLEWLFNRGHVKLL